MVKTHSHFVYDAIIMGDSRVYRDLSPKAMGGILRGWRILNFGYNSGGLNSEMFHAAEAKLDTAGGKKTIILGVTAHSLTLSAAKNEHYRENKDKEIDYIYTRIYFPKLVDFFNPICVDRLFLGGKQPDRFYYQIFYDDGWVASWSVPENPCEALPSFQNVFKDNRVSPDIVKGVIDQTRKWVRNGITVFAFRPPSALSIKQIENEIGGFDEQGFIRQFEEAGGIWIDIPNHSYHSFDGSHMDKESAVTFSKDIAECIRRLWVQDHQKVLSLHQ
jgi:hypothetical protein